MSELDQLLKQDPDFLPLNDWKKDNDTGDEIKNRKNYADYVRGEYVSAGAYSDRIENEISQSTLDSAVADGVIKADDQAAKEMLFTPDETDLDSKLQLIQTNLDTTDPAWDAATKYLTFKKLNPDTSALPEDIRAKGEQYFTDAQSVADTGYRKAVKSAVRSGELPLAKVMNDEGEYEILVSPTADAMNMAEAIRASKKGGVSFADAPAVQAQLSTPIGLNEPLYKFNRYSQAASFVEEFAKKDSYTSKIIQNYSDELAAADKDGRAPKSFDEYASSIRFELNKSGLIPEDDALSNEEVSKALTQIAYNNANAGGQFKLYDKPEEAYKNVRNVGFSAAFVHPAALVNDDLFAQSVTNNPNLSDDQKKIIEARREPALQQQFDATNELLSKSSKSDEWLNALQSGRVAGKKDTTIVKEFVSNPDNFSEIQDRLVGVGKSIVDGIGEMAAAVPMMMGADWARDYMVGNLKERSNRREVARLFGAEYGAGQDIFESIAPMLADVAATGLLAAATAPAAGAGGAAFLAAKQGARLTAKGLLKGMTSSALRQLPSETAEGAAERLVAQGLVKASTTEAGISGAQAAIKGFNSELAKTIGVTSAVALPAFNRSAGSTYASVYTTLENNKDLTPEEKHDRALGAGLAAGATTALITGAFGAFGRGGLEDALLSGASRKQIKNVVARLSNVDDISDEVFNKVISKQVSETLKKYGTGNVLKETGKEIFKNSVDEGAEEGLDQFVNGFITDAATDEDTPFLEKLEQSARAALIGGVIGGGVPAVKAVKNAVVQRDAIGVQIGVETEFARNVSNKLTESGSPLTAQTVYSILTAPRRTRAPYAQAILEASRQQAAPAESVAEVEDSAVPKTNPTAEEITEALNNAASPDTIAKTIVDERGQSQFAFVEDIPTNEVAKRGRTARKPVDQKSPVAQQLEFDYTSKQDKKPQDQIDLGLDTSDPKKPKVKKTRTASSTKSIKKAKLADQLNLDFDSASVDEQNNHINANYSDEDLSDAERADIDAELQADLQAESGQLPDNERIRMTLELFGALESGELAATKPKGKKSAKNIPAQSTAAPAKPPILGASIGSKEPMFSPDEFIDDELIGQEVAALTRIATLGYPVRLERKALHGMPQRGKYPTGYLVGKSDMVARKVSELYPVRIDENAVVADTIVSKEKVSFYDPKVKSVVRKTPKASIDDSGVGIFNNDPVSMKLLLDRRIPVIVPDSFVPILNPSFRTKSSGGIRLLNDIVMTNPETGTGFVSVLTKEDEVISGEPNYKYYINLSSFTALFNPEITARSIPDPKGGPAEVTLDSIIQDADALYAAASSDRQNSVFGSPSKARATLHVLLKPRQGTLEQDFFEAAVSGFSLSVRKEAYLHELRLGMDKYAERKSGEVTPSLKPNEIQNAIGDFISRTKVDRATAARNIANVFGSDIDPETQPDLVLQKFIEGTVLVRPPYMPTFREIGAKVGNAFAEQQRTRDTFARKALFETTDPTDLLQIQDNTDLFDPEAEAADNTYIAPTTPFEAPDSSLISKALKEATFDATDALDSDPEMRASIDRLLRRTVFKGNSAIDITKLSSSDAFGMLASWMASGNYNTNPDAIKFQRDLRDGAFVSGDRMRRVMKLMYLSSKTVEGDPSKDDAYVESLRESLANSFGRSVSKQEASDFIKSIGNAVQPLWSRSYVRGEQVAYARQQNDTDVARLGLKTNDPESVIRALKTIASTEADANKRLLAKLLLENQGYIRQVEFSLDESPLKYAGAFLKASNGQPMISINLDGHNGRGLADVLLHEYTHAFVSISVASPNENLNAAQRGSLQRINGILELARRSAADNGVTDPTLTDGLENLNEFVTHFFTSTDFQGFLKALLPPTKQRGFFARMVDAVLDMFGLGRSKQSDYQKAFTDIVDLTREAVLRAPMTPAGLINRISGPASRTLQQVSEAAQAINDTLRPTQVEAVAAEPATATAEADIAAEAEAESIIQEVTEQDIAPSVNSTSAETLAKVKDIIRMVRRMVPAEFPLEINTDMPYAAAFQGGKILLNPNAMSGVVADLDPVSARGVVEGIMTEEAAHAASYNALTQQELDNYVATLKDADFDNVIDNYYQTDELKVAAKARIRSEDPAVAAREREGMAEELLRMHSQKVTRGFTTEEDYMFWRSKPSLLKIVGRYMKGFINRYMAGKSIATMNGTQRATLQRMITEVRAINAGYRLTPNTLEFDAQNPHATMAQIATQLGVGAEPTGVPELMPMSAVRVLHNDSEELPKPDTKTSNRKIAQAIAEVAENYWGRIITSKDITQAEIDEIINNGTREFIAALGASGKNAADWYSTAIEVAMEVASLIHPELSNIEAANKVPAFAAADNPVQAAQFAMRMALAITSQNLNVNQNTGYAEEQFNILKQTGKFDSSKIYGAKAKAIQSNLELANILVNKFGFSKAEQFARAEFTVKELSQKASEVRNKKVTISGLQEDAVFGSAVFGPKIGQGFLQNLMSNFGPVTVDLWMRRTWGRWTGDVIGDGVTDERLAALLTGAREAGIALPRFASQLKITTRRKVLESGKLGAEYQSVSDSVIDRIESDPEYREQLNKLAGDLYSRWQKQYKLLDDGVKVEQVAGGKPIRTKYGKITKELLDDYRSGKADLETILKDIIQFEEKLDKQFAAEKAKAKEKGVPFKTKIADWRYDGYKNAGRTESLKDDISNLKPKWAKAAANIKQNLNPIDVPTDQDRRVITEIVNGIRRELESLGYEGVTNADIQAVLWYPEKDLWAKLAGEKESNLKQSYDDEFINIATQRGLGEEARQLAESVRADRATRNSQRNDDRPDGEVFGRTHDAFRAARATQIGAGDRLNTSYFNFTVASDRVQVIKDLIDAGDTKAVSDTTIAVVRHALSDLPQNQLGLNIEEITGVWGGTTEPAVRLSVTAQGEVLDKVRSRLAAVSLMFDQDEFHEFLPLSKQEAQQSIFGATSEDKSSIQQYLTISLDGPVVWSTMEAARAEAGISGASFSGNKILIYSTDGDFNSFITKAKLFTNKINDIQRIIETDTGRIRLNRYSREGGRPDTRGYTEINLPISTEGTTIGNDLVLNILKHTGGRLPAPVGRSLFTANDLTPEQIRKQSTIADDYESLPVMDLENPDVITAYKRANAALEQQWNDIIEGKIDIEVIPWTRIENGVEVSREPYASSKEAIADIRRNGRLRVLQTTPEAFGPEGYDFSGHPLLEVSPIQAKVMASDGTTSVQPILYNDVLRAVHDTIAHGLFSDPFGPVGEEGAWKAHMATISDPWAKWAITQETRGQNSWVNYGPQVRDSEGRVITDPKDPNFVPITERGFALQKAALVPIDHAFTGIPEVDAPLKELQLEIGSTRSRGSLATQFGAASQLPAGFNADTIDYSNFLESLEMPMMEIGTYQSPKGMLDKLLKGELDPRILRLKNQRDFFNKATFDLAQRYKTKLDKIIDRDFGGIENAPVDLIQDATGSTKGLALPEDVLAQIEDDFNYDLDVIDTDDTLTADDKRIARGIALMNRDKSVADAEKTLANSIRTRRDDALNQLATLSPELVQHIVQLRTLTDEMSKKVASLYGFPPELKAKFDNQLGIYLTRSYKMFDEIGFGEKVLTDPDYEAVREAAIIFFEKQFIDSEVSRRISGANGVPRAQAEAEAKRELGLKTMGGRTYGQLMMEEFVNSYDKTGKAISATNMSRQLKPLLDNVQLKRDLPKEIRDLLGEKGAETGVDNLLRSLVTTGTMAANQSFLNNVRDIGRAGGWLITATELNDGKAKDYDTFGKYKPIRETTSSYDPLGELYGPPEMVDAFRKVFSPDGIRFNQTTAQEVVDKTIGVASRLSGGAMAAKTLGSIGFYVRNIVSNALFFAPAQGFVNFKSMATKAYDEVWSNAIVDPAKIDSYRTKLISLGVIGDDINTNIMTAMLRGGNSVDDVETKLGELIDTANKGTKPLRWLAGRAQVLSASVDSFYKIAYYENELRVLKEARAVDTGTLASASDSQLERMAADKVLATAQSSSQAPPLVQEVTKSGIGLLFAPFLRFKVEVPRIVLNTYKTAMGEMKSSNPVLKQRGITRFAGMTFMLSGVSAIVPAVASALAGIGEDEDEALRSSVPEYLRNHTFFYRRKADGQLQSWDFTFLNPFSIIADPTMRSMEQLFRGNPAKAAAKFVETAIFDQYLDDQILSSAVQSLRDNENPSTKKPIYEEKLDNAGIVLLKSMAFLFKEAYQPSVMKRAIDSYQAVGADYTEFDDSPAGILMREFYPVKRHDIELDKQLRNYLSETRDVYNRISERKNALFSKKAMETDDVKDVIQSEIEDKAKINEDIYKKLRGFEGLGLAPQQLYQITTGMGYGKDRTRLLFNKIMDRPVLTPEYIKRLSDPENEQGAERLKAALEVLQGTPRYIMLEP